MQTMQFNVNFSDDTCSTIVIYSGVTLVRFGLSTANYEIEQVLPTSIDPLNLE